MTTIDAKQFLKVGSFYKGRVLDIQNAVKTRTYQNKMSYQHEILMEFDELPDYEIRCCHFDSDMISRYYSVGEHVRIKIINNDTIPFLIHKDTNYHPKDNSVSAQQLEEASIEAAEFIIPGNTQVPDLKSYQWNTAIIGAATFSQYHSETTKTEFLELVRELFTIQQK